MFINLFKSRREPDLNEQEQLILHHVEILKFHDTGDASFEVDVLAFAKLYSELVPEVDEARTVQGELIRCVDRLASEDRRNGCMNWGEFYVRMVVFLRDQLPNGEAFSAVEIERIEQNLELIEQNGVEEQDGELVRIAFGHLLQFTVNYCRYFPEPIPRDIPENV